MNEQYFLILAILLIIILFLFQKKKKSKHEINVEKAQKIIETFAKGDWLLV